MADFLTNLWNSVFTPGPTPTLLVATNASFAALQLLLGALFLATYSYHFIALSALTAGLWWAINWFARELRAAEGKEEEAKRLRARRRKEEGASEGDRGGSSQGSGEMLGVPPSTGGGSEGGSEGGDTETETELDESMALSGSRQSLRDAPGDIREGWKESTPQRVIPESGATGLRIGDDDALRKRRSEGEAGELSTDSEWEKVSDAGQ